MRRAAFDQFCQSLTGATHVIQWGGASVWKIGGKIFAIAPNVADDEFQLICFKVSDLAYDVLTQQPGIIPAPYLARAKWVQIMNDESMSEADIKSHLEEAHRLIATKLAKAVRQKLGLLDF